MEVVVVDKKFFYFFLLFTKFLMIKINQILNKKKYSNFYPPPLQ